VKLFQLQLLGPQSCFRQSIRRVPVERQQVVAQRFPLLRKASADEFQKLGKLFYPARLPN
jgi:hypothetical protein